VGLKTLKAEGKQIVYTAKNVEISPGQWQVTSACKMQYLMNPINNSYLCG